MIKWSIVCFFAKWSLDTYSLIEIQIKKNNDPKKSKDFDPYKLLHMEADGSFGTEEIQLNFDRLEQLYHPSRVNKEKVPYVKALRRWENLQKAHATLTIQRMNDNWKAFGDPNGCLSMQALEASLPTWLLNDDMKPMIVTWGFIAAICAVLGGMTWAKKNVILTKAGTEKVSETNMREFMIAILEENDKS